MYDNSFSNPRLMVEIDACEHECRLSDQVGDYGNFKIVQFFGDSIVC